MTTLTDTLWDGVEPHSDRLERELHDKVCHYCNFHSTRKSDNGNFYACKKCDIQFSDKLHDAVDKENETKTCGVCGNEITIKMESYEFNEGQAGEYDYESGHDPSCTNFRKEI